MFDSVSAALHRLAAAVDELCALDLTLLDRDELLTLLRDFESQRRRLPVMDHRLIAEIEQRGVAGELCARDTPTLLRDVLRLSPHEARQRVRAAVDLGPRHTLTGAPLDPLFAQVAAAQAAGTMSPDQARVVVHAVDKLPPPIKAEHGAGVEHRLVDEATRFDPETLAKLARHIGDRLDPDGTLADDAEHQRRRTATLVANRDGSGELRAHLTPSVFAHWQAVLDPLACPRPADADGRDTRTPGERMHDALADAAHRLLAGTALPATGGTPATVLITMTLDQLETRTGLVTTSHGGAISVDDALRIGGEATIVPVIIDRAGVLSYGRKRRIATAAQRDVLAARDGGCCFPGCDAPPGWTQAHHVVEWIHGGTTDIQNLCLLCGYHHREFEKRGWTVTMKDGHPWWIPPAHIDPVRTPIRNTMHGSDLGSYVDAASVGERERIEPGAIDDQERWTPPGTPYVTAARCVPRRSPSARATRAAPAGAGSPAPCSPS